MSKITGKETDQEKLNWNSGFDSDSIKKASEVDIKPKLSIDALGIENGKAIEIISDMYIVNIPKDKAITGNTKLRTIDVIYEGIEHQFICESGSFRFQISVLIEKLKLDSAIGLKIFLWKEIAEIKTPKFTGKAEVYLLKTNF